MLLLDYKQSLSFSHILFKVTWVACPSGKAASCKKWGSEHGGGGCGIKAFFVVMNSLSVRT